MRQTLCYLSTCFLGSLCSDEKAGVQFLPALKQRMVQQKMGIARLISIIHLA